VVGLPITSIEMFSVLGNTQVLFAHLLGLLITLWLLQRVHRVPAEPPGPPGDQPSWGRAAVSPIQNSSGCSGVSATPPWFTWSTSVGHTPGPATSASRSFTTSPASQ
jgi:hypothetical protein